MVSPRIIDQQLRSIGCNFKTWGNAEARELSNILMPYEDIKECLNGHYENGFAMLCATNQRIILVDRKPMHLTLEDVRYDMIAEIDYGYRLMNAQLHIYTPTKALHFSSWNQQRLRKLASHAQQMVMELRQNQQRQAYAQPAPQPKPEQLPQLMPVSANVPEQSSFQNSVTFPVSTGNSEPSSTVIPFNSSPLPSTGMTDSSYVSFSPAVNTFARVALTSRRRTKI